MSQRGPARSVGIVLGGAALVVATCIGVCVGVPCIPTGIRHGMWIDRCPTGDMRLAADLRADGWVRGRDSMVVISPQALYLVGDGADASVQRTGFDRGIRHELTLLDGTGAPVSGFEVVETNRGWGGLYVEVQVPAVPDGDYTLRAKLDAGFEVRTLDVRVPLYAPALVHLATDRPLYKRGQDVLLRSVTWRRTDLAPLDGRPGTWRIYAPDGSLVHEERADAGPWGIAATAFPLDRLATVGTWRARWESGEASDEVTFDVRPFKLPRFTVELSAGAPWFGMSDTAWLQGRAVYASGAPVQEAPVTVQLQVSEGRWPMPLAWEAPVEVRTDARGRFTVDVGQVPADLLERSVIVAAATVVEPGGEVARSSARMVLSEDPVAAAAVTAFGDGLAEGFNNRVYLRVTTPDGRPLRNADVEVRPAWDPSADAQRARTDVDGVAALQVDPGAPITVVVPAPPVRVRPLTPDSPRLNEARELVTGASLGLAERRALDALHPGIAACGTLAPGGREVTIGLEVAANGRVADVVQGDGDLDRCVALVIRQAAFEAGTARMYRLRWAVPDTHQPSLVLSWESAFGPDDPVREELARAASRARACLPRGVGRNGAQVITGRWRTEADRRAPRVAWSRQVGHGLSPGQVACIEGELGRATLSRDPVAAMGVVRVGLSVPRPPGTAQGAPTTTLGYELAVSVRSDGVLVGDTRLRMTPGDVPPLRLRATPSLTTTGETVSVQLLRGPAWSGRLPESLRLMQGTVELDEQDVVDGEVRFTVPATVDGFLHVEHGGARAVVFVRRPDPLTVDVSTAKSAYAPGEQATLVVTAQAGGKGVAAAVGLMGVDSTLGQLVPLLAPDDPGRVLVRATSSAPAFDAFDAKALVLGTVRGENAAKAAVMRIASLPMDPAGDAPVDASVHDEPDATLELTASFYAVHAKLRAAVREWERAAPRGEVMDPPRMAKMWQAALTAHAAADGSVRDAWGRAVTLDVLPHELLVQVDPRVVVSQSIRLPEDVVDWVSWVQKGVR